MTKVKKNIRPTSLKKTKYQFEISDKFHVEESYIKDEPQNSDILWNPPTNENPKTNLTRSKTLYE